jgi:hypothetical protein
MSRLILGIAMILAVSSDPATSKPESITRSGRVVLLADALKAKGVPADPEPIAKQVALVEADGTISPLLSDESSRAFFADERLRNRKTELTARKIAGLSYLQVVSFRVEEGGVLRTPEYYCEVCHISVRAPQTCPCCQGPMDLQMKPN